MPSAKSTEAPAGTGQGLAASEMEGSVESSGGSTLQAFNQLPVKTVSPDTQKEMQEDSVTTFLRKVDEQEKDEQKQTD